MDSADGRFTSRKLRWLHHIDIRPRLWFYLVVVLSVGFVQHVVGAAVA